MNEPVLIERMLNDLFAGRATPLQKKAVEAWLREPGHAERYFQYLARYEATHGQYAPDLDTALTDYQSFMEGQAYPRRQGQPQVRSLSVWRNTRWMLSVAASVLLVLGLGYATRGRWAYEQHRTPYGQTRHLTLPDGSEVTLNANSAVRLARFGFGNTDRHVWLTGEAYFSIRHTVNDHAFTVHTNNLDVRVLGTRFNVNTRSGQTEVVLNEGKVELIKPRTGPPTGVKPVLMRPGEAATLAEGDTAFRRRAVLLPEHVSAYRQNRLVFDETPLSQVAQCIQEYYGIRVVVSNRELARRELTGTLPNNDLSLVLRTLSLSYNLSVDRQPNQVVLRPH